ncbi:MAG: antibiotic biosynthesis monooxygenase [Pseudomonadales bacterium]|nr:antibiotic biosynthesis monooxygenase [Pseudomonadales bacterium]
MSEKQIEEVREILIKRAERSRQDDGCRDYAFSINIEDPRELRLVERWESEEKLMAHLNTPDEEFTRIIDTTEVERAIVVVSEVTVERELLKR